jgi:hypothetical protein
MRPPSTARRCQAPSGTRANRPYGVSIHFLASAPAKVIRLPAFDARAWLQARTWAKTPGNNPVELDQGGTEMKHAKMLGLLAAAVATLAALAATASATTLTGPTGDSTPTIHAVNENGHIVIENSIADIECASTFEITINSHGAGVTASGNIASLTFGAPAGTCTNSWQLAVIAPGTLQFHYAAPGVGLVKSSGMTITAKRFGVTCTYATNNTEIGELTDSDTTKGVATLHLEAILHLHSGSAGLCGVGADSWEGSYETTQGLTIHQ